LIPLICGRVCGDGERKGFGSRVGESGDLGGLNGLTPRQDFSSGHADALGDSFKKPIVVYSQLGKTKEGL
jgi:hypothetical protein